MPEPQRLPEGQFQYFPGARVVGDQVGHVPGRRRQRLPHGTTDRLRRHVLCEERTHREGTGLAQQTEYEVLRDDLGITGRPSLVLCRHDDVPGTFGESAEALLGIEICGTLCYETLLDCLLRNTHTAADVGPGRAGATGLVDEVADQVVGDLSEMLGGEDRVGQLFQGVGVDLFDGIDEVVQPHGIAHGDRIRHASTLG